MSGLFSMLGSAARAMDAQRYGLDVTGQNIANANTPGYTRRRALLSEVPPPDKFTSGSGVRVDGVAAERNPFLERRLRAELPAERREAALAESLAGVELAIADNGSSLNTRLNEFFDSFARLADTPTSSTARQEVLMQGEALGEAFGELSDRFEMSQRQADDQVRATVDDINALAAEIAGYNQTLANIDPSSPQSLNLRDQVRQAVETLTKLASVEAVERDNGVYDIAIGGGRTLVIGDKVHELSVVSRPATGLADIVAGDGTVVTDQIPSGRIAGFVHARDQLIPGYQASLDELAYAVVTEVNAIHTAGYDSTGTAGQMFFQSLGSSTNAARLVAINPALAAPGGEALIAASNDPAAVGDNGAARALAALRDERVMAGNAATFDDFWGRMVYRVGRDTQAAKDEQHVRSELVRQVESLRDSVSGVSMDEEAANLMRFQRAYEANARYFRSVDESLQTLLTMVGA
jgi:flagellar hook-associated protein 1 FlgK